MDKLSQDYLKRANIRLEVLEVFYNKGDYADVVREAQEVVELVLKAVLRNAGIDVPKIHDVSRILEKHKDLLLEEIKENLKKIYGAEDFIPLDEYITEEALQAIEDAKFGMVNIV